MSCSPEIDHEYISGRHRREDTLYRRQPLLLRDVEAASNCFPLSSEGGGDIFRRAEERFNVIYAEHQEVELATAITHDVFESHSKRVNGIKHSITSRNTFYYAGAKVAGATELIWRGVACAAETRFCENPLSDRSVDRVARACASA